MEDETSDILGQQTKPVLRANKNDNWFTISLAVRVAFAVAILLVLYVVIMRIWFRILVWKERSYKLAMRRRHGIPDNDHRPFNVAYAAVLRARQEKEAAQKAKATQSVPLHDRRNPQVGQNVRQRFGLQTTAENPRASSYGSRFPGAYFAEGTPTRSYPEQTAALDPLGTASRSQQTRHETGVFNSRRASRKDLDVGTGVGGQKRGFVEDRSTEEGITKRSKRENEFTGNETDPDDAALQVEEPPQRVAKRYLFDEDDDEDDLTERQPRDKRARKVSLEKGIQAQEDDLEDMDVDEELEDEVDDLPFVQRGKKRDRVEAGSTFGGDDDESGPERDADLKSKRRRRKPSTVGRGKSDIALPTRGHKRDRDLGGSESEIETDDETSHISRKKRGKRAYLQDDELSEPSTARSQTSSGSRNRRIGEEWSSNGIRWKLGPNGQRLRQALVKKTRQRFSMPEDSQHPDRQADFEVYVEIWLNEEEYREAKVHHLLAGQDTPKRSESKLAVDVQTHTSGKNLLWSAASTPVDSPASYSPISDRGLPANQRIVRTSLISSSSPRSNPFDQLPTHNMRRISSITRTASVGNLGASGLADTTNSNPHGRFKTYSKIEKQELEAQALLRLRELKNRKEAEINQAKAEQVAKDKENIDKATAPAITSTIPSITVTAPTDVPKQITQPTPSLFNPAQPADDTSKSADAPKSQPLFGFPSTSSQPSAAVMPPMVSKPLVGSATPNTSPFPPAVTAPVTLQIGDKPASSSSAPPSSFPFGPSPASSSATGTTQPTVNPFTPATTVPAASTTSKTDQVPKPSFLFNFPSSNPAPNTNGNTGSTAPGSNTNTATSKPVFSFGLGAPKSIPEQKAPETASQFISGNNAPLGRPAPPATVAASSAPPQSSPFNFAKPTTDTSTPNPFTVPAPQPASTQANSNFVVNNTSTQPKFNFGLGNPANTSSTNSSTVNNAAAPATVPNATSSNPFGSTTKSSPMVSFTPLTPNGGAGVNNSATGGAPKTAPDPSPFGFKAPTTSSSNFGFNTSNTVATSGFGAPDHSNTNGSNTSNVFGSTVFGTKPTENKGADSSGTLQANKMSFNFGVTGGQTSSSNTSGPQGSNPFGQTTAPKPATTSSSLFGALGSQPANTFGSTSNLGTTNNPFGLSNTASNSSSGPTPTTGFGSQPNQAGPSSQTTNIFGNTGATTSSPFGFTKPTEAPKPMFSIPPTTNGTTPTTAAPSLSKPSFQFNPHAQNNSSNNSSAPTSTTTTTTTSGFAFNFGSDKSSAASRPPQQSGFNAPSSTPSTQSNTEANPNPFNFGSSFTPNNGLSATGIFGSTEQK